MICIIALVVFAILAVFSAKYRPLAAEAFDCVFRRVTFRKCTSGLDKRLKARITGKVMRRHKRAGRFLFRYFEVFSWLFLILLLASLVQVGISVYNYAAYGNCNGPDETGFCIFDPLGNHQPKISDSGVCAAPEGNATSEPLSAPDILSVSASPQVGSASAPVTIIEFGCFSCPNTAKQAPAVRKLIEHFGPDIRFVYVDFPLPVHEYSTEAAIAARCVYEQDPRLYWEYHFLLFEDQESFSEEGFRSWAISLGLNASSYDSCYAGDEARSFVDGQKEVGLRSGVFGTPTFFIDGEPLVGVQPYKLLKARVDEALKAKS